MIVLSVLLYLYINNALKTIKMVNDEEILKYFIDEKRNSIISARINRKNMEKNTPEYKEYLENRFDDFRNNYCEVIYRIKNKITSIPTCKKCGKPLKYHGYKENSYGTWCSTKCQLSDNDFITHREKKYTDEDVKERTKKMKETRLKKYGDENYNNREKAFDTCLKKYGSKTPLTGNKRKEWEREILEKYGKRVIVNNEKTRKTKLERYGDENYNNREKYFSTMEKRYGQPTTLQSECLRRKVNETLNKRYGSINYRNNDKAINTMKERYGVSNPYQLKSVRDKIDYIQIVNTKRKNGTLNSSKYENDFYERLKRLYPFVSIIRSYQDERYKNPETNNFFQCDFYIKEFDLFIELNSHYTHGKHPFDENNKKDKELVELYKSKACPSYRAILEVWTHRDVIKFKEVKDNNLNYVAFYGCKITDEEILLKINKYKNNI